MEHWTKRISPCGMIKLIWICSCVSLTWWWKEQRCQLITTWCQNKAQNNFELEVFTVCTLPSSSSFCFHLICSLYFLSLLTYSLSAIYLWRTYFIVGWLAGVGLHWGSIFQSNVGKYCWTLCDFIHIYFDLLEFLLKLTSSCDKYTGSGILLGSVQLK